MINKTEQEIMKNWKGFIGKPIVSVCCITYNHENYIAEALDSFLMQETDFVFEVIVRDDASPDKTADVIRQYEIKYPNIIKTIYEKENGYQKGIEPASITFARANGEYIALCEGDDYWTDAKKLQVQIDKMKEYPDVNISFHPAYEFIDGKIGKMLAKHANKTKIFTTAEVILGGGGFCPSASLIIRKEVLEKLPVWFRTEAPVGDYFMQIFGSLSGGALYIDKVMSNYRIISTSWTGNITNNWDKRNIFLARFEKSLMNLNNDLHFVYSNEINRVLMLEFFGFAMFSLNINRKNDFMILIEKCVHFQKDITKKIWLYFHLRRISKIIILIEKIRSIFENKK